MGVAVARLSYLTRRDGGRYYLQMRMPARACGRGSSLLRVSLGTSDYREARLILAGALTWLIPMRDEGDLERREAEVLNQLRAYNARGPVQDHATLRHRVLHEYVVRKFIDDQGRRNQSQAFNEAWMTFCNENMLAEGRLQEADKLNAYERGRHDSLRAQQMGFPQPVPSPDAPLGGGTGRAPPYDPLQPGRSNTSTLSGDGRDTADTIEEVEQRRLEALRRSQGSHAAAPAPAAAPVQAAQEPPLSVHLKKFLVEAAMRDGDERAGSDVKPVIEFMIALLGDKAPDAYTREEFKKLDFALPDIPNRTGMDKEATTSLYSRYQHAQLNGWDGLKRLTGATIQNRYHSGLNRFFNWLINEGYFKGPKPKLSMVKPENLASLPRDSFEDGEIIRLISLPLFTGCAGLNRVWQPGPVFIQNHLYWGYVILLLTGMRVGEVGQLKTADIIEAEGLRFFDLRPFDARKGRVAFFEIRRLKTHDSARVIPCHPLIIELGLLDRASELEALGEPRLLPEWQPYTKPSGQVAWGYPLTKSYQYLKRKGEFTRADLTLYATRHLMGDWLDKQKTAQRTRDRIMGHSNKGNAGGRYGSNRALTPEEAAIINELDTPLIREMRRILLGAKQKADARELTVIKPWLKYKRTTG